MVTGGGVVTGVEGGVYGGTETDDDDMEAGEDGGGFGDGLGGVGIGIEVDGGEDELLKDTGLDELQVTIGVGQV